MKEREALIGDSSGDLHPLIIEPSWRDRLASKKYYILAAALLVVAIALGTVVLVVVLTEDDSDDDHNPARPPNIVIIFADDTGYADLSCYGHPSISTPNLDRMAIEGIRFTRFYTAAPICSPSRGALLTGRLPIRSGLFSNASTSINGVFIPSSTGGLPPTEITIASALKTKGYATAAIGKWHLGNLPQFRAVAHGFDSYLGIPYSHDMCPCVNEADPNNNCWGSTWTPCPIYDGNDIVQQPANLTTMNDQFVDSALQFMENSNNARQPFFLYFASFHSHYPPFSASRFFNTSIRGFYGDAMTELDWTVGQIMNKLTSLGLDKNTLVFFSSDNGPELGRGLYSGSAGLLQCGKGTIYEGGIRVSALGWWPGKIPAGTITTQIASTLDLFPTSLKIAGVDLPSDRTIDGTDLSPILFSNNPPPNTRTLFHYLGTRDVFAVTMGPYKAHFIAAGWGGRCGPAQPQILDPPIMYQIEKDPAEMFPLVSNSTEYLQVLAQMQAAIANHENTLPWDYPAQFDLPANPNVMPCCNNATECVCGQFEEIEFDL